jgi:hypothetical protein
MWIADLANPPSPNLREHANMQDMHPTHLSTSTIRSFAMLNLSIGAVFIYFDTDGLSFLLSFASSLLTPISLQIFF